MKWKHNLFSSTLLSNLKFRARVSNTYKNYSVLFSDQKHLKASPHESIYSYLHLFEFCVFAENFDWKTVDFVFLKRSEIKFKIVFLVTLGQAFMCPTPYPRLAQTFLDLHSLLSQLL